jgi:hypothetical protein
MHHASIHLALKLDYHDIPVPERIVIQLEPGEIRLFKRFRYAQHPADPLSAVKLTLRYGAAHHLQIAMQLAGRIALNPGGDFKFGGTRLVLMCQPVIAHNKLMLQKATIREIEMPVIPRFFKTFVRELINKSFVPNLGKSLNFDLESILDEIRKKVNDLDPINLDIGKQKFLFRIAPNIDDGEHELKVAHDAIHLRLHLDFVPQFEIYGRR